MYRRIEYQDNIHQYDSYGNPVTTWNEKYCEWIINEGYESDDIDWQPDSNGITEFPRGVTMADAKKSQPNADNYPVIQVTWEWDESGYIREFHEKPRHPSLMSVTRTWEYLDYTEEMAKKIASYCGWDKTAKKVVIKYNNKIIYDNGK